ncbi:MAG: hypothetical protein AAF937_09425 [Planctomycetota bacterium]
MNHWLKAGNPDIAVITLVRDDDVWAGDLMWDRDADGMSDFGVNDEIQIWWDFERYVMQCRVTCNGVNYSGYLAQSGNNFDLIYDDSFEYIGAASTGFANDEENYDHFVMHTIQELHYTSGGANPIGYSLSIPYVSILIMLPGENGDGGGSGVDPGDWDFWYDQEYGKFTEWFGSEGEEGKFDDIHEGLEYWLGGQDDQPGALFSFFQLTNLELQQIASTLVTISQALTDDTLGEFDDPDWLTQIDEGAFAGVIDSSEQNADDVLSEYQSLLPQGTDSTSPPDMSFDLPISQWFAGVFPGVSDMEIEIEMAPFHGVRNVLHAMFFAGVAVWSVLAVLAETRRT